MREFETALVNQQEECRIGLIRFMNVDMNAGEVLLFAAHVRECFECRQYLDTLASLLHRREWIRKQLQREEAS